MSRIPFLVLALVSLSAVSLFSMMPAPLAHESWISRNGLRNTAGEWCCGEGDCFAVAPADIKASPAGYRLINGEFVPYSEVQPSADGAYWRCMRPDGSRRCFFAPPSGS